MDNLKGTTARLRRTFAYPTDDSSATSSAPEALDEEEQEHLIQSLAAQNASSNRAHSYILLSIPILSCLAFLPSILLPTSKSDGHTNHRHNALVPSLLALTSLLSTAYLLHVLPTTQTGVPWLDRWAASPSQTSRKASRSPPGSDDGENDDGAYPDPTPLPSRRRRRSLLPADSPYAPPEGPLLTFLPYMNAFLALLVLLSGWLGGKGPPYYLPTLVYGAVLIAKVVMAGVDVEGELGGLRYGYKGA